MGDQKKIQLIEQDNVAQKYYLTRKASCHYGQRSNSEHRIQDYSKVKSQYNQVQIRKSIRSL